MGVSIQNSGNDPVNIISVSFNGLKNNKSANIDFSGENTSVSMQNGNNDVQFLAALGSQMELNPGGTKIDLVTGQYIDAASLTSTYLMWPQTAAEIWAEDGLEFVVNYTIDEYYDPENPEELEIFHKELKLKDSGRFGTETAPKGIEAGHKYFLNLQFKAKAIELTLEVLPWYYTEFDLDYSSSSISANNANGIPNEGVMWLYTKSVDTGGNISWIPGNRDTREVVIDGDNEIRGIFYIGSPHNGQWQITTYPAEAAQYFRVEPNSGEITSDLVLNHQGLVEFFIYPNGPVDVQQTIWLNLAFRFNGENQWRDGNTEFNRKGWHVVREP